MKLASGRWLETARLHLMRGVSRTKHTLMRSGSERDPLTVEGRAQWFIRSFVIDESGRVYAASIGNRMSGKSGPMKWSLLLLTTAAAINCLVQRPARMGSQL